MRIQPGSLLLDKQTGQQYSVQSLGAVYVTVTHFKDHWKFKLTRAYIKKYCAICNEYKEILKDLIDEQE